MKKLKKKLRLSCQFTRKTCRVRNISLNLIHLKPELIELSKRVDRKFVRCHFIWKEPKYRTCAIKDRSRIVATPIKIELIWYAFPKFFSIAYKQNLVKRTMVQRLKKYSLNRSCGLWWRRYGKYSRAGLWPAGDIPRGKSGLGWYYQVLKKIQML